MVIDVPVRAGEGAELDVQVCVCGSVVFQLSDATDNSSSLENYESI